LKLSKQHNELTTRATWTYQSRE